MESLFSMDVPTGYLEDAIAGWSNRYKPQKTVTCCGDHIMWHNEHSTDDNQSNSFLDFSSMETRFRAADGEFLKYSKITNWNDVSTSPAETITRELKEEECDSPASALQTCMAFMDCSQKGASDSLDCSMKKIAYPFDVLKRGGMEGHATLKDINCHMLMPPTRPVRHPVGDYASPSSSCMPSGGFGISGKVVVALTKIHTHGRGTITVIRTKS